MKIFSKSLFIYLFTIILFLLLLSINSYSMDARKYEDDILNNIIEIYKAYKAEMLTEKQLIASLDNQIIIYDFIKDKKNEKN